MKKTEEEFEYPQITPVEFELMLEKYGMTKTRYSELRGKSRTWFYSLRNRRYLRVIDVEAFIEEVGLNAFKQLVREIKN